MPGFTMPMSESVWKPIAADLALSRRETEIVRCVLDNLDTDSIAVRFAITERTVRAHLQRVYGKLGVRGRAELILLVFAATLERGVEQ